MKYRNYQISSPLRRQTHPFALGGFTMVEAIVGVTLIGIGVAATLGALTKFNSQAAISRNATGALTLLQNQVDLFQSMSPFNPQKGQIPKAADGTYDMTLGTHTIKYKDPITGIVATGTDPWPVYREPSPGIIIVKGTMTCTVTDISTSAMPNTYKAVFTIGYTFGSRDGGKAGPIWNSTSNRWEYQASMSTIRTSDI